MVLVGWWNQKGEGVESEGSGDRVIKKRKLGEDGILEKI
jgi:hypothetical protein